MAKSLQDTLRQCLEDLERCYDKGSDKDIQETLQKIFCLKDVDFYSLVLAIVKESKHVYYLQRKSIAEVTLNTFKNWLLSKGRSLLLTDEHKDNAMDYLVKSGIKFTEQLRDIFQLDKGIERGFLFKHLEYLYDSKNDPKTAAIVAIELKLQDYVDPEELLLPLIASDKFQVAEALLKDSRILQERYGEMLNRMCGFKEDDLFDYIQNKRRLSIVDKTKFTSKTLTKISEKAVKRYGLDPVKFPNIFRKKNLGSLRYLVSQKYKSPDYEFSKWDGLIKAAVANDTWLQEQLIFLLAYQHHDSPYAANLAKHLNIPRITLPPTVRLELDRNQSSDSLKIEASMPQLIDMSNVCDDDYDDYDDDGFMFSTDDVKYDETKECRQSLRELTVTVKYWSYPLPEEKIKFINTCDALRQSIRVIFKGGNIIGFDGEWQPKYGRAGQKDKMAIMQLAVKEEVYIIDIFEFDRTQEGQELLKVLFNKLFTSEDTLRLGFGIDSDIKVIIDTYPYANEFLRKTKNFEDLLYLSKQILKLPCVINKLGLTTAPDKEKGLSQLVKQCLGKPLDKTFQISNWEQRPLSKEQLLYAALDALCLVKVYDVFEDLAAEFQIVLTSNPNSGTCQSVAEFQSYVPEERVVDGPPQRPGQLAVVCDTMLQGLGKYLRCCGVDTVILQNGDDHMHAVELYYQQKRVILTRGKAFNQIRAYVPEKMCMCVPEGTTAIQVAAVLGRYNVRVTSKDIFSRCQLCNGDKYLTVKKEHMLLAFWKKTRVRPKESFLIQHNLHHLQDSQNNETGIDFHHIIIGKGASLQCEFIPPQIFDKVDTFFVCESCGKVYWEGSHFDKIADQFSHIIVDSDEDDRRSFYEQMRT